MLTLLSEILLSMFFVFGVYSAANEVKLLARRLLKRHLPIDKRKS